jgi:hypothetical protein
VSGLSLSLGSRPGRRNPEAQALRSALLKIKGQLRLQASSQSAGEWTNWVDVLNSNPGAINAARRPAVGASNNGLPLATFATNDCVAVPILSGVNYSTTRFGYAFWMAPVAYGSAQSIVSVGNGTGGASVRAFEFEIVSAPARSMKCNVFDASGGVKIGTGAANAFPVAGTQVWTRIFYDSTGATDADKLKLWANEVPVALTFTGAGTHLLRSATGNILLGNYNDGVASQPYAGSMGPNIWTYDVDFTAAEGLALMNVDRPT